MVAKSWDLSILIEPSEIEGQWVSHCLEFDVISQGDSPSHALEMLQNALEICIREDLESGVRPDGRGPAPREAWDEFQSAFTPDEVVPYVDEKSAKEMDEAGAAAPTRFAVKMAAKVEQMFFSIPHSIGNH